MINKKNKHLYHYSAFGNTIESNFSHIIKDAVESFNYYQNEAEKTFFNTLFVELFV